MNEEHEQELSDELEKLRSYVREAETLEDLKILRFYVGPSDQESQEASERLEQMDKIYELCSWDKPEYQLTSNEQLARERWNRLAKRQGEFESRYC